MATVSGSGTTQRNHRRNRQERGWLLAVCLSLAALLGWFMWQSWHQVRTAEHARLTALATAAEKGLAQRLDSLHSALSDVRDDRSQWLAEGMPLGAARRMRALKAAMPGVRQLAWLDAQGQVVASSGDAADVLRSLPGGLLQAHAAEPGNDSLRIHVAAGLATTQGVAALASVPVRGEAGVDPEPGAFGGIMLALVEAAFFSASMQPLLYAPDMVATVVHGDGTLIAVVPDRPGRIGTKLDSPQSLFMRHREAGGGVSVQQAPAQVSGVERLAVLHDLVPRQARMAQPLVLVLSRAPASVHAAWLRQTWHQALAFGLLAVLATAALLVQQRRRAALVAREVQQERQRQQQAERLELALAGADLALWDSDLVSGQTVVNARWFEMLGHAEGAFDAATGWASRVHPDDLDAVQRVQLAHQRGDTPSFETSYRMRHALGHWVWVLARGRVVERGPEGQPLRMVGTHMDVTERMQAQEALRHSEQSLAITLASIGDAVIATDTAGCVTRMNPAAERLTDWPLADALGLPLSRVFRIFNARTREPVADPVALVLARGDIVGLANDTVLVARDGREHQIADSAAPIRAPQAPGAPAGDILGVVLVFSDVTEQYRMLQALRDRERQFAAVAEALPGPVSRVDGQGRYVYANSIYERWFGVAPEDIVGRTHREVLGEARWATVASHVQRALAGEAVQYECPVTTVSGQRLHVLVNLVPDHDKQGQAAGFFTIATDISERKRAEDALRDSEGRVQALLASLSSGVVVHAPDTAVLQANPAACQILGLSLDQMMGKLAIDPAWCFLDEDGQPLPLAMYPVQQLVNSGQPVRNYIGGLRRPDRDRPLWVLCNGFPVLDATGAVQQLVVTFTDITERKEATEELRRSEGQLRMAGRIARLGGWRLERDGLRFSFAAESLQMLQGPVPDTPPGQPPAPQPPADFDAAMALVDEADRARVRAALLHSLETAEPFDELLQVQGPAAEPRCLRVLGEAERDASGRVCALQGAVQDITEAQAERQRLQLLEACVAQLNDVVLVTEAWPLDEPGPRIVFANQAFERLTGWRPDEALGHSPRMLQGPLTDRTELRRIRLALEANEPVRAELVNYHRSGGHYWTDVVVAPVFDGAGQVTHRVAVQRDITQRKQAEDSLREAQQALQATLQAVPDLLFEIDLEGRIHGQHSPRDDLLLVPPTDFIGRLVREVVPADAAAVVMDALRQAHEQGRSAGQQYALALPEGRRWFELSVSRKPAPAGELPRFIALARDITERRRADDERQALERQLREAQKMESIGTLAGGIAHDFNNILAAILGNVALARDDLPPGHGAVASLDQIQRAGQRARSLVQQILTFSRRGSQALSVQPLRAVVEETLELLRATLPAGVQLQTRMGSESLPVLADATQLPQVLMNLCTNAWHALPEGGGQIEVGLEQLPADDPRRTLLGARHASAGLQPLPEGPCAHLWVRDEGQGMDAATRQRIFDPFFTTKPVGQGTGLGLSVVHGIVNSLNGAIRVESVPGQGSCFRVFLPLALADASATRPEGALATVPNELPTGGRVLYVDDDEVMQLMVQRLLQRAGHQVLICADVPQALAVLRDPAQAVDLLVTDFNMPGLSGLDLCRQVRALRPSLPMVISSGYLSERLRAEALAMGVRALLKKEHTLEDLPGLVRDLLGPAAAAGPGEAAS